MRFAIDFPPQNLLGAGHCEGGNLATQRFTGTSQFTLDLFLRAGYEPCTFLGSRHLCFLDDLRAPMFRLRKDLLRLLPCLAEHLRSPHRSLLEILSSAL